MASLSYSFDKLSKAKEIFLEALLPSTEALAAKALILAYADDNTAIKY